MKENCFNLEKIEESYEEYLNLNKFQKNEIEFDFHGISFSDTCSSV
jgi:hypothetical protein